MAQRFQLVCRFIKILYSPSLSSDTRILYTDCLRNFSTSHRRSEVNDVVDHEQRRSDTICYEGAQPSTETRVLGAGLGPIGPSAPLPSVHIPLTATRSATPFDQQLGQIW